MKNLIIFVSAVAAFPTLAESDVSTIKFKNNSNQYVYMATKGANDTSYVVNTILGWVNPQSEGEIKSDDTWFTHMGIQPKDRVSIGFQDGMGNISECAKDVQLTNDFTITLDENMKCSFTYKSSLTTRLSAYNLTFDSDKYRVGWKLPVGSQQFLPLTDYLGFREVIKDEIVDYSHHGMGAVSPEVKVQYAIQSEQTQEVTSCGTPVPAKGTYYVIMEKDKCDLIDYSVLVN